MPNRIASETLIPCGRSLVVSFAFTMTVVVGLTIALSQSAQAQNYQVLHYFTGGADGTYPAASLTMDADGNYYGTSNGGRGKVFKLSHKDTGWIFTPLQTLTGSSAYAPVVFGRDGALYGTTRGGGRSGCGTIFKLTPPEHVSPNIMGGWTETVLYEFRGAPDGCDPVFSPVTFDGAGNMYLTTALGGADYDGGAVIKLSPYHGGWIESVIHSFPYYSNPLSGVILDNSGNLCGTLLRDSVFQLTPSGSSWILSILHDFGGENNGNYPTGGLVMDQAGNLYGTTRSFGPNGGGTVFELVPANGSWTFSLLHSFTGYADGGPWGSLAMDATGNLYGTTCYDSAYGHGAVFKLTRGISGWTYTSLHDFTGSDGGYPYAGVVFDKTGNLYGATTGGGIGCGSYGCGVVFQITP